MEEKKAAGAATGSDAKIDNISQTTNTFAGINNSSVANYNDWGKRLDTMLDDNTILPIWGLPQEIQGYIRHVAQVYQCPQEIVTVAVFSAISTAAGAKVTIHGKYDNSLCAWFVDIMPTGGGKSTPTKEVLKPLFEINKRLNTEYKNERQAAGKEDEQPRPKRIIFRDATREARAIRMSDYPHGSLLFRDEFSGLFKDFCRYSPKSGEREELLSIYDNDSIQVDRKGSDPIFIERPFLNILGGIQPDILTDAFAGNDIASGLVGRFLYAWPYDVRFPDYYNAVVDDKYRQLWAQVIETIYNAPPVILTLPGPTMVAYADYFNLLQARMRELDETDQEGAIYSKAQIQVIRLAGITHVAKMTFNGCIDTAIGADTMCYAAECLEYFVECGKRVLSAINGAQVRRANKTETLRNLMYHYPSLNISKLADAIHVEQPWLSAIKNGRK